MVAPLSLSLILHVEKQNGTGLRDASYLRKVSTDLAANLTHIVATCPEGAMWFAAAIKSRKSGFAVVNFLPSVFWTMPVLLEKLSSFS
nr:hypothetical protein [uncultured Cohaesibacter sp.]